MHELKLSKVFNWRVFEDTNSLATETRSSESVCAV